MKAVVVGSINADLPLLAPRLPLAGETLQVRATPQQPGGKGANQAVALARLGVPVTMLGMVGDDTQGDLALRALQAEGVDMPELRRSAEPTGLAVVMREPGGESTILVAAGANADLSADDVRTFSEVLGAADCVLIQLEIGDGAVAAAVEAATGLVVLNPAPARLLRKEVLSRVDVLVPNRLELAQLCGATEPASAVTEIADMARSVSGPRAVVVTLGAAGCLVWASNRLTHLTSAPVQAVDTTGAGDAFCGALVAGLLGGRELVEAARWANMVAGLSVTRGGAMNSLPRAAETRNISTSQAPQEGFVQVESP